MKKEIKMSKHAQELAAFRAKFDYDYEKVSKKVYGVRADEVTIAGHMSFEDAKALANMAITEKWEQTKGARRLTVFEMRTFISSETGEWEWEKVQDVARRYNGSTDGRWHYHTDSRQQLGDDPRTSSAMTLIVEIVRRLDGRVLLGHRGYASRRIAIRDIRTLLRQGYNYFTLYQECADNTPLGRGIAATYSRSDRLGPGQVHIGYVSDDERRMALRNNR